MTTLRMDCCQKKNLTLLPVCGRGVIAIVWLVFASEGGSHRAVILPNGSGILMVTASGNCTELTLSGLQRVVDGATVVCSGCTDNVVSNPWPATVL